jgi:deoxyribodipyrimidine photolyase-related protein
VFPHTHAGARAWFQDFLVQRFESFGDFEDAMAVGEIFLWHSAITPMLNIGLLTPKYVLEKSLKHGKENNVPINSLEGFVRQVIGWREFMRSAYHEFGTEMRTKNVWNHHKKLPKGFWDGNTGIFPIDDCLRRIKQTGYCHHIERLMLIGGFLFLCEVDPKEIYAWFMENFADSYDWVMVPNVYAMSQNSAGGLITTKPYFSGSNYVLKMSHYKKGDWCEIWDGLYWRWIEKNSKKLEKNHRWAMMVSLAKKNKEKNREKILKAEDLFF